MRIIPARVLPGKLARIARATVVFPVPTSPVSMAKPPPSPNPACRCTMAS
ncbi:Uncharacterised protein [Vibrio cholerae]|nr:Uncharacterised protein [Vibrio cholerae]